MKRKLTLLIAALALLTMGVLPGKAWAETVTLVSGSGSSGYTVPEGWTTSGTVEGGSYLKFDNGTITSPEFAPHNGLSFTYSVATFGSGTNHPLTIRILNASTNAVIVEETTSTPTSSSSYITTGSPLSLGDITVAFKIQMYAPTARGVRLRNYSVTGTPAGANSDLALTGAPVALSFDLYNNSDAQVIHYTTSSTGTVTIADNQYFTKVIDETNKTITVTPTAVTPSAQTITVNQAADATYAAGSVTFTVSIEDSTPAATSNVAMASVDNIVLTATYNDETLTEGNYADINQGTELTLAYTDVATGYTFTSWVITKQEGSDNVTTDVLSGNTLTVPDYDINISATISEAQQYTITFNPGSGTCATSPQTYYEGTVIEDFPTASPSAACAEAGYTFDGWSATSVDESSASYTKLTSYTVTDNAYIYAVYSKTEVGSDTKSFVFENIASANNWENGVAYTPVTISPVTLTANGGGNNGKYYTSDKTWRMYNGGTVNITTASGSVTEVSSYPPKTFTISEGAASLECTETIKFTQISVSYSSSINTYATAPFCAEPVATPVLSKGTGYYASTQSVTITCETEGASIYYTLDGTDPTSESTLYEAAISISETKTLKAIAVKSGYNNSEIVSATYTILTPFTTMEAVYNDAVANTASHKIAISFNNWVITGTNSNSNPSMFYLTDTGNIYGCVISGSGSGFVRGNTLSGTVICNSELYTIGGKSYPQLTGLTTLTDGLTVGTGGNVTSNTTTINALTSSMTGTVIKLENLTYNGTYLADGNDNKILTSNYMYTASLTSGKTYNITGVLTWAWSSYGYQRINPRNADDIEEVVPTTPTIYASPASLTGFTYAVGNGPSATQTISVSGTNLEDNIGLALNGGDDSAFEISLSENSGYSNTLSLTQSEGAVSATTVYVRMKAGLSKQDDAYEDVIGLTSTGASSVTISLSGTVTDPLYTWDLTIATYNTASTEQVQWTSSYATMTVDKNGANQNANAYLNQGNPVTTRFYIGQKLTFAPRSGYTIDHVEITGTSGYVGGIDNNAWENAESSTSGTTVTITPTDNTLPFYDIVSGTVRLTSVTVYYAASADPFYTITIDDDIQNGTVVADYEQATEGTLVTLTINPNTGYYLNISDLLVLDSNFDDVDVTKVNGVTYTFEMPDDDVTVYASFSVYTGTYYTLVTNTDNLVTGRHYIIASEKTPGTAYAMGAQNENKYRDQVAVDVVNNMIYETEGVYEIVLSGDASNYWTLYDETTPGYLHAYNSTSNQLGTRLSNATNESYGQWAININEGVATIVSQVGAYGFSNTIKYNSTNTRFSCYTTSSTMAPVYLYMKANETDYEFYSNTTYSSLTIGEVDIYTVHSPAILNVTGTLANEGDHENLIIEEGGQLIHTNDVNATLQKNITGASSWKNDPDGWYFIASPVDGAVITESFTFSPSNAIDLFRYDEPSAYWMAYWDEPGFENMVRGSGYLHASQTAQTVNFAGEMINTEDEFIKPLSYECEYADLIGFNLVGNPFTRNLVEGEMTIGGSDLMVYYGINDETTGMEVKEIDENPIKPGQGFFVQATSTDQNLIITPSKKGETVDKGCIRIAAGNDDYMDKAYIQIKNGNTLRKMNIANSTKVYVMNGDDDYAATRVEELAGAMPVNFKAIEDGTYTITVETKNIDAYYLHLIDNFTNEDIDLLLEPTYTFTANADDAEGRFRLVFDFNDYTGIEENNTNSNFVYQFGNEILVNGEGTLQVFDVMGRLVTSFTVNGNERLSTSQLNTGVYIFRMVGSEVKTQKIVVR